VRAELEAEAVRRGFAHALAARGASHGSFASAADEAGGRTGQVGLKV
jgi:hypothetical protein